MRLSRFVRATTISAVAGLLKRPTRLFRFVKASGVSVEGFFQRRRFGKRKVASATAGHAQQAFSQIQAADLKETMQRAAATASNWDAKSFVSVKRLRDATSNHGFVDMMKIRDGGRLVAVKRMPTNWIMRDPHEFKQTHSNARERPWFDIGMVQELNNLKFPNVCELMGIYRDDEFTYVVTSLATKGDLFSWSQQAPQPGKSRESQMKPLTHQIFSAVRWMHDLGVAHRDLSLENITVTDAGRGEEQIKIIDFGMCTLSKTCRGEVRGKRTYQAPEMHIDAKYSSFLADDFAIGVVMFAMATTNYPWASTKPNACRYYDYVKRFGFRRFLQMSRLHAESSLYLSEVFSASLVQVLEGLLRDRPSSRLCVGESCFTDKGVNESVWNSSWVMTSD